MAGAVPQDGTSTAPRRRARSVVDSRLFGAFGGYVPTLLDAQEVRAWQRGSDGPLRRLRALPVRVGPRVEGVRAGTGWRRPHLLCRRRCLHPEKARWAALPRPASLRYSGACPKARPGLPATDSVAQDCQRCDGSRGERRGFLREAVSARRDHQERYRVTAVQNRTGW